ncbi:hypothetical protein LINGRAPRIM_LOCUS2165 [Linum grandiflorum]
MNWFVAIKERRICLWISKSPTLYLFFCLWIRMDDQANNDNNVENIVHAKEEAEHEESDQKQPINIEGSIMEDID